MSTPSTASTPPDMKLATEYTQELFDDIYLLGKANNKVGAYFENVFDYYIRLDPVQGKNIEDVLTFRDWHNIAPSQQRLQWSSGADLGIDRVVLTKEGKPLAAQMKFRSTAKTSKSAIDAIATQILTEGRNNIFQQVYLVTNQTTREITSSLTEESNRLNITILGREWFDSINEMLLQQNEVPPTTFAEILDNLSGAHTATELKRLELRPHQVNLRNTVIDTLVNKGSSVTTVHAACGTGKTLTAWAIFDQLVKPDEVCVIYTPALSLVDSIAKTFGHQQSTLDRYDIKAVCSDRTVNAHATSAEVKDEQDMDPSRVSSPVLHNASDVAQWLQEDSHGRRKVLISTYASANVISEATTMLAKDFTFALQMNDEAHKLAGVGNYGNAVWDISSAKTVSLTATPRKTTFAKQGKDVNIVSMSDEVKFGHEQDWATYSIRQAINDGVLSNYKIEIMATPYAEDINDEVRVDNKNTDARLLALTKICQRIREEENQGKGTSIVFLNGVSRSKRFEQLISERTGQDTPLPAFHIDGTMKVEARLERVKKIVQQGGVLSNVGVLKEGVDIPSLNAVIFADQKNSKIDIIQSMGRVLRKDPANPGKIGRVIIPIAVTDSANAEELIEESEFGQLWEVFKAIADHDDSVMEEMVEFRRKLARGEKPKLPRFASEHVVIDASALSSDKTQFERWQDPRFEQQFLESLTTVSVRSIVSNWWERVETVKSFIEREGRLPTLKEKDESGFAIGYWCRDQRRRKDKLSPEQFTALEGIPEWKWQFDDPWQERFETVKSFIEREGRLPTLKEKDESGFAIGYWCKDQRRRKDKLSPEQVAALESIPEWKWQFEQVDWQERFETVKSFIEREGRLPTKVEKDESGFGLGSWCKDQRRRKDKLSPEQFTALEGIPEWKWQFDDPWQERFETVKSFIEREGRLPTLKEKDESGFAIGYWCKDQRRRKDKLSPEQVAALESIPEWKWKFD